MKVKIEGNSLILIGETIDEYRSIINWKYTDEEISIEPRYDPPTPPKESPAKVIEIRVTGIPSEIHILKGDLT